MKDPARHLYRKGQGQQKLTWLSFCLSWLQLLPVFPAHSCSTLYYLPFPITCPADFKLYIRLREALSQDRAVRSQGYVLHCQAQSKEKLNIYYKVSQGAVPTSWTTHPHAHLGPSCPVLTAPGGGLLAKAHPSRVLGQGIPGHLSPCICTPAPTGERHHSGMRAAASWLPASGLSSSSFLQEAW